MKNLFDRLAVAFGMFSPIIILFFLFCTYLYPQGNENTDKDSGTNSEKLEKKQYQSFHSPIPVKNVKEGGTPMQGRNFVFSHSRFPDSKFHDNQYTLTI